MKNILVRGKIALTGHGEVITAKTEKEAISIFLTMHNGAEILDTRIMPDIFIPKKTTKKKYFTITEINARFIQIYPNGNIDREYIVFTGNISKTVYRVQYEQGGKTYKYQVSNLWELAEKLNLVSEFDKNIMKGLKQLICGCWIEKSALYDFNPPICPECNKKMREKTAKELDDDKLWEC